VYFALTAEEALAGSGCSNQGFGKQILNFSLKFHQTFLKN
jgi:hypothetical protein